MSSMCASNCCTLISCTKIEQCMFQFYACEYFLRWICNFARVAFFLLELFSFPIQFGSLTFFHHCVQCPQIKLSSN